MASHEERVRYVEILLVEDNPGDVRLIREALHENKLVSRLSTVSDGQQALAYLRRQERYSDAVRPDLILLDLNLPRMDGREVLKEIKADPDLKLIPVLILTSSGAEEDITKCYSLHANCYISKPVDLERFFAVIKATENFWVNTVTLPTR